MSRSAKKGPWVDPKLIKKIAGKKTADAAVIKTWSRASEISPEMVGFAFAIHNVSVLYNRFQKTFHRPAIWEAFLEIEGVLLGQNRCRDLEAF